MPTRPGDTQLSVEDADLRSSYWILIFALFWSVSVTFQRPPAACLEGPCRRFKPTPTPTVSCCSCHSGRRSSTARKLPTKLQDSTGSEKHVATIGHTDRHGAIPDVFHRDGHGADRARAGRNPMASSASAALAPPWPGHPPLFCPLSYLPSSLSFQAFTLPRKRPSVRSFRGDRAASFATRPAAPSHAPFLACFGEQPSQPSEVLKRPCNRHADPKLRQRIL